MIYFWSGSAYLKINVQIINDDYAVDGATPAKKGENRDKGFTEFDLIYI